MLISETMGTQEKDMTRDFFDRRGLKLLTPLEESMLSNLFGSEMQRGLRGEDSSVKMFRSLLQPAPLSTLPTDATALIVEVGGTNLYAATVQIEDGIPKTGKSFRKTLPTNRFPSARDFFHTLADPIGSVVEGERLDALGVVYSFAGSPFVTERGVDVMSPETLTKGFVIPGISEKPVGQQLSHALEERFGVSPNLPTVVLNDTVAVLFAGGADIGGVVGTGYNLAFQTPEGIVNSECGNLMLNGDIVEKQTSGLYIGNELQRIAGKLGISRPEGFAAHHLSELIESVPTDGNDALLQEAAVRLRDRSSQIVGVMIGTVLKTFPEEFLGNEIRIPIEGSFFWGVPSYEQGALEAAQRVGQKDIRFVNIPEAGRVGAGAAALSFVNSRK